MLIGMVGAIIEGCVRIYFYVLFCKDRLQHERMNPKEKMRHAVKGTLRVQDASNGECARTRFVSPFPVCSSCQ